MDFDALVAAQVTSDFFIRKIISDLIEWMHIK